MSPSETGYQCPECQQWHRTRDNLKMHRGWAHPEYLEREVEALVVRRAAALTDATAIPPRSAYRALAAARAALHAIRQGAA